MCKTHELSYKNLFREVTIKERIANVKLTKAPMLGDRNRENGFDGHGLHH